MTSTPEHAAALAGIRAADARDLRDHVRTIATSLMALDQQVAEAGDDRELITAAELALPMQARLAEAYRSWLARRPIGVPPFTPGISERMHG